MKVQKIEIDKIDQNENSRVIYKQADLAELMASMRQDGQLQPIGVRELPNGKYDCVWGNRRLLAAKKLEWPTIAANIVDASSENERDILNIVENLKRTNTTLAEDGRLFQVLIDRGLKAPEIAARLGISMERVRVALEVLHEVPKEFHKDIVRNQTAAARQGKISATAMIQVSHIRSTA